MNRRALNWALALLMTLGAVALVWRNIDARQAAQRTQASPAQAPALVLGALDVVRAQKRELTLDVPIFGPLRAVHSALVKARVAGELRGLTVREGDSVRAGQVLAHVEPLEYTERLHQAARQVDAAQAQVDIAQRQYDNNRALVAQGFISQTALDTSAASLQAARANVRAAQAGTEVARKAVADTVLKAPIDGQIAQRLAQPGERVVPEARIVEIIDARELELEASLSAADSLAVRVGQSARLTVEGASGPVAATVVRINPSAQSGSRSVLVYLAIAPQQGLRQGLFADGRLTVGTERALAVPLSAVRTDKPKPYVQALEGDGENRQIAHRPVTLGVRAVIEGETWVAVTGIEPNTPVLRAAAGALNAGTRVQWATKATP